MKLSDARRGNRVSALFPPCHDTTHLGCDLSEMMRSYTQSTLLLTQLLQYGFARSH
jgi:hypothetical protein